MSETTNSAHAVGFRDGDNCVIRQPWINQSLGPLAFLIVTWIAVCLTIQFPEYTTFDLQVGSWAFAFPSLNCAPVALLGYLAFLARKERFVLTPEYFIHVTGRLEWRERSSRIEYDRIQEIEISQTIFQRMLGVGDVKILPLAGSAESSRCMSGVRSKSADERDG